MDKKGYLWSFSLNLILLSTALHNEFTPEVPPISSKCIPFIGMDQQFTISFEKVFHEPPRQIGV